MAKYYNENTKKASYKWRENNKDEYLEYMKPQTLRYYHSHKIECNERRMKLYYYRKECEIFRKILL